MLHADDQETHLVLDVYQQKQNSASVQSIQTEPSVPLTTVSSTFASL
jgi:hypothetical protein